MTNTPVEQDTLNVGICTSSVNIDIQTYIHRVHLLYAFGCIAHIHTQYMQIHAAYVPSLTRVFLSDHIVVAHTLAVHTLYHVYIPEGKKNDTDVCIF